MNNATVSIAILAGGLSKRFGSNKAFARWGRARVIDQVFNTAKAVCKQVFIVVRNKTGYAEFKDSLVKDLIPGKGPLSGLHSALTFCMTEKVFLLACDMPLVNADLLRWMISLNHDASILIPEGPKGLEPLHAIYHKRILPSVEKRLLEGKGLAMRNLLKDHSYEIIPKEVIKRFCPDLLCLESANTPSSLRKLACIAGIAPDPGGDIQVP